MKTIFISLCLAIISNSIFAQWTVLNSGTTVPLYSITFTSQDTGYAVGYNGTILKTTNAGSSWSALSTGTTINIYSIYFVNSQIGYAVGKNSIVLKTNNAGSTWSLMGYLNTNYDLNSVYFTDANTGYA